MENNYPKHILNLIEWLQEKKAEEITVLDVQDKTDFTDFIVLCNGSSGLHMKAIADNVIRKAKENKLPLYSKEGLENDWWILLDFVDVVLHIFSYDARKYYRLEEIFDKTKDLKKTINQSEK